MESYKVLGIMSGTSLDGLDLACCHFERSSGGYTYAIENATTVPYPESWQKKLAGLVNASALELTEAHINLGTFVGKEAGKFISAHNLNPRLIACHGHTIFHQPQKGFSLQIGSGYHIMTETGITVVNDFRSLDVALGGQGAPLVPIGDELLFKEYDFCLNLGGIANISASNSEGKRIAYDICPANMVLNLLAQRKGLAYDAAGLLASGGKLIPQLLATLNQLDFYSQPAPKSLGYEWVAANVFPLLRHEYATEDLLHTFCTHMVQQIDSALTPFSSGSRQRMLVTGGGAYNSFFIKMLKEKLVPLTIEVVVPDNYLVEYKEALIFAFLGVLRIRNEINCLSSVTGARQDSCSGQIFESVDG